ncbi:ABC transporter ATP-binding protein [Rhizobium rhizogenes]|uniref:ABC transporter ATP-binding protein n=1 Tax=Rhizobium rhizogenes TaxID=359 RepID=UPI0004D60D72|nr:ABC transporter ATP-binding protein [Rhizobium rhizogenes]KEA04738.1 sugar ABC transporter ATP-binding protein [Rhizobium rhizogenes]MQB33798.1 ABC transporter ATP-binding protein [Rhizobium rhizogenes]NTI43439.1 ABC transporter ATP-binding protein [Rhizobium rhizogenes]NTI82667.1 ABC transporter ATP-binding protein [Rhizobium rhizogenes]NTJ24849.1 ABC transporter ATP-binding protein [Rhizobium rhizogenes]
MTNVLTVSGVGKCYAAYKSNLQRFATWFGLQVTPVSQFWANRDISFNVKRGEALALIGQNGAGKSTLLKIITGTVRPTTGNVGVHGRISAILELGLGFNPEFTGRQNILHAGGLMGMSQQELTAMMPDIEDFAEIGEFFDQPTRVYSSGMQARLAFALATAKRPEVLIVDEVLSVGDSYFQHKSFDRIRQFKEKGTSIILVTHGLSDVRALCDRVILLDKGAMIKDGTPDEVVDFYNAMIAAREGAKVKVEQKRQENGWLTTRSGTFDIYVSSVALLDEVTGETMQTSRVGQHLVLKVSARAKTDIPKVVLGIMLRDRTGHVIWGTNTWHSKQVQEDVRANETLTFELAFACSLGPGSYSFSTAITGSDTHLSENYEWQDNVVVFDVVNVSRPIFIGTTALDARIEVSRD